MGSKRHFRIWVRIETDVEKEDRHLDFNTEDTLSEEDVSNGLVDKVDAGLTRVDHETVGEFHRLGTGSS
jgi:hypothetical protein